MYRIFCDSCKNYLDQFSDGAGKAEYRIGIALPIALLCDAVLYAAEKESESEQYKQLSDLLFHMEQNMVEYPAVKAFLWTLESRGMSGKPYGIVSGSDLNEQVKLVIMLLKLMYWEEPALPHHEEPMLPKA